VASVSPQPAHTLWRVRARSEQPAEQYKLPKMVGIVLGDEQGFTQDRVTGTVGNTQRI
jgi:hypothetical protein